MKTLYTAVGRFQRKGAIGGLSCPVIFVGQQEYLVDLQEMLLWTVLNWRILEPEQIEELYRLKAAEVGYATHRSWDAGLNRLNQRGLLYPARATPTRMHCITCCPASMWFLFPVAYCCEPLSF